MTGSRVGLRSRGNADLEERWAGAKVGRVTSYLAAESLHVFQMAIVPSPADGPPFGVTMAHGELLIQRNYEHLWPHKPYLQYSSQEHLER